MFSTDFPENIRKPKVNQRFFDVFRGIKRENKKNG